jgi:hypothetical protein
LAKTDTSKSNLSTTLNENPFLGDIFDDLKTDEGIERAVSKLRELRQKAGEPYSTTTLILTLWSETPNSFLF